MALSPDIRRLILIIKNVTVTLRLEYGYLSMKYKHREALDVNPDLDNFRVWGVSFLRETQTRLSFLSYCTMNWYIYH